VAKLVNAKAPKANLEAQKLWLDIVISDVKVLEKVPADYDNAKLANLIREQADFTLVIDQLAKLLTECGANVKTDKDVPAAEKKFKEGMEKIVDAATIRGAKPIAELCKVRVDNIKYAVVQTVTLIGHVGAVITGAVALAGTPFTGGASTILGIVTLVNQSIAIGQQVAKLAMNEEQLMNVVASDLKTMYDNYKGAEALIGPAEMAKTLVTATLGIPIPSIDGCKKDCDQVTDKINRLFEANNKQAEKLGKVLTEQQKGLKEINDFLQKDFATLQPAEKQQFAKVRQGFEKSPEVITALIEATNKLDERVKTAQTKHKILSQALNQLAGQVPTWAVVGQFLIKVGAAVGFLVAGNVNVPDPYKCMELATKVTTDLGNVIGSLQGASDAAGDMNDMIGKRSKK
jgi:archaellum component FlaC